MTMIAVRPEDRETERTERRVKKVRPGYLSADVLERAAADGERRLLERMRKMQGECQP